MKPGRSDANIRRALELRARGYDWQEIARTLGYASAGAVQASCSRYKNTLVRKLDARLEQIPF